MQKLSKDGARLRTMPAILSERQVEEFIDDGFVRASDSFPPVAHVVINLKEGTYRCGRLVGERSDTCESEHLLTKVSE
jgi:hypothetical protein